MCIIAVNNIPAIRYCLICFLGRDARPKECIYESLRGLIVSVYKWVLQSNDFFVVKYCRDECENAGNQVIYFWNKPLR